ncbi:MAG: hypothetical protein ABW133_24240 [Polyangiaceae bacterium]
MTAKTKGLKPVGTVAFAAVFFAAMLGVGCAAPMSVKAARSGDLKGLRAALDQEKTAGKLDQKRVTAVAQAVAEREIRQSAGAEGALRIEEARSCWRPLASTLEDRADRKDDPGAEAMLALLDGRPNHPGDGASLVAKHGGSQNPMWRAVAARGAVGTKNGDARRKFYVDPDERVRLAGLRAGLEWADPADAAALLEAARLDPNPVAQAIAARAAGGIENAEIVLSLRDRYAVADEGLRQSIVDAWARPALAKVGGRRELVTVAENQSGAYAIEAGAMLLSIPGDTEARAIGQRTLVRAMGQGLARDRKLAIGRAPIGEREVLDAIRKAAQGDDVPVKVAALVRLGEIPEERTKAWSELRKLADGGSNEALFALARAGDPAAADRVMKDLGSTNPETRLAAMNVLVAAGRYASAAPLLADANPGVRMRASCAVLTAHAP